MSSPRSCTIERTATDRILTELPVGSRVTHDDPQSVGAMEAHDHVVFADGWDDQLATKSGSNDAGYAATLLVRV